MVAKTNSVPGGLAWRIWPFALVLALLASAVGCGGGSSGAGGGGLASTSPVQLKVADDPDDRVVAFSITINSIQLTPAAGSTSTNPVTVLSTPATIEVSHLDGGAETLSLTNVPQGSYSQAAISFSNPRVVFLNDVGVAVTKQFNTTATVTVNLSPALVISAGASVLNLDLNLFRTLTIDPVSGSVTVNPMFTLTASAVPPESEENEDNGEMPDTWGVVTATSSSSFTMTVQMGPATVTFNVDGTTQFENVSGISALISGMLVKVDAVTQPDGSLLAKKVEVEEQANGLEAEGLVNSVTGNPATQFSLIVRDGSGLGIDDTFLGHPVTVNVDANTQFRITDEVDLGNLSFTPAFDATTLRAGQHVDAETDLGMNAGALGTMGAITAQKVTLRRQPLRGTVSNYTPGNVSGQFTFTLNLPTQSYLTLLSGQTSVTVVQQPGTELKGLASVANNATVRVRGVLFSTGSGFTMVATRIIAPE